MLGTAAFNNPVGPELCCPVGVWSLFTHKIMSVSHYFYHNFLNKTIHNI